MAIKNKKVLLGKCVLYIIEIFLALIFLFPFYTMIVKSLMGAEEYWSPTLRLFPNKIVWDNYVGAFSASGTMENGMPYMIQYLLNTLKICLLATVGLLLSASFCAFGFTKIKFPGRDLVFAITLATTMIPGSVMIVPLYSLYSRFHWIDTHYPMWVGMWFGGGAANIFLVMQYMKRLPKELTESASTPLLYLESQENYTLALGVSELRTMAEVEMPVILAACTMMTLLPLVAFIFNQKFFVESVVTSGVKG